MFDEPTFLVQVGHHGHKRAENALKQGYADGAILSPADYTYKKNRKYGNKFSEDGGTVLFDPQFYIPRTDRQDLTTYSYFEEKGGDDFSTAMFASESDREDLCRDIIAVQDNCSVDAYISPARFVDSVSDTQLDRWLDLTESFIKVAREDGQDIPVFASLPVDGYELTEGERRDQLLNRITSLDPDGFYVSVQYDDRDERLPLKGEENVEAYLRLMLSLRTNRFEVIAAHTHQIAHLLLGIGINVFASGHYQNLRSFDVDRWVPSDDDGPRTQVVRYYSDQLLNAVRVNTDLEEIVVGNKLDESKIRTQSPFDSNLFTGTTSPEGTGWKFSDASWEHYIWSCNQIAEQYQNKALGDRIDTAEAKLNGAESLYKKIKSQVGELDSVDDAIYEDWKNALKNVRTDMNDARMQVILEN